MKRSYDNSIRLQNKTMNIAAANPKQMVYPEQSKHQNAAKPYLQQNSQLSQQTHQVSLNELPQHSFHQVQNNVYGGQQFMHQQQPMVLQVPNNVAGNCQQLIQMRQSSPYEQNQILTQIITPQGNFMVPSVYTRTSQNLAPNNSFVPQYYTISNFQQPYVLNNATQSPYNMVHNQNKATPSTYQPMQHVQQPLQEEVRKPAITNGSNPSRVTLLENMLVNNVNTQPTDALNRGMAAKMRNSTAQNTATNMMTTFNTDSASQHAQNISRRFPQANICVTPGASNLPVQTFVASVHNGNEQMRTVNQPMERITAQSYQHLMPVMPKSTALAPSEDVQMPVSNVRGDTEKWHSTQKNSGLHGIRTQSLVVSGGELANQAAATNQMLYSVKLNTSKTVSCEPPVEVMQTATPQQQFTHPEHSVQQTNIQPTGQSVHPIPHMASVNRHEESQIPMALKSNVAEAIISTESAVPDVEILEPKEDIMKEQPTVALESTESAPVVKELPIIPKVEDKDTGQERKAERNDSAESDSTMTAVQQRSDLLTHVIEGIVIQESNLPFPIHTPPKKIESEDSDGKLVEAPAKVPRTLEPADYPKTQSVKPYKTTDFVTERNNNMVDKFHSDDRICVDNMSGAQVADRKCRDGEIFEAKSRNNTVSNVPKKQSRNSDIILKAGNVPKKAKRCEAHDWSVEEVYKFIKSISGCEDYAQDFAEQEIDGEALFLIKTDHLMDNLAMKLGPALKVLASIQDLRPKEQVVLPPSYDNEVMLK